MARSLIVPGLGTEQSRRLDAPLQRLLVAPLCPAIPVGREHKNQPVRVKHWRRAEVDLLLEEGCN
jgi:hypothetical protein